MPSSADQLRILSLLPGRVRLHLPGGTAKDGDRIEDRLGRVPGVNRAQVNRLTGNVLIHFDPRRTGVQRLRAELQQVLVGRGPVPQPPPAPLSPPTTPGDSRRPAEGRGPGASRWVRAGVRGLLGHTVVDSLWFGAGWLGSALGLPLAGLGPLHVLMDIAVWGMALRSAGGPSRSPLPGSPPPPAPDRQGHRNFPCFTNGVSPVMAATS
jgi:hypothetical protein